MLTRRQLLEMALAAPIAAIGGCAVTGGAGLGVGSGSGLGNGPKARGNSNARVVVIGGGYGGTIAARYIKRADPSIRLTLVERNRDFISGPFANTVITGLHDIDFITRDYRGLVENEDIDRVHDEVVEIDPVGRKVMLRQGAELGYDRLVVSPGIALSWDAIAGYDQAASEKMPHAWKGAQQIARLRHGLQALEDGSIVIVSVPEGPYSGPSAPYERASLIANYLQLEKPRSKVLVLDANDDFDQREQFEHGWERLYPGMIERVPGSEGGRIVRVEAATGMVFSADDKYKGGLVNVIPPQTSAALARQSDLTDDSGWCPVDQRTFESKRHADIHVVGDAAIAGEMPKTGLAANSQAKVAAAAVVSYLNGQVPGDPSYLNTCYSLLSPEYGISTAAVYRLGSSGQIQQTSRAGGSPTQQDSFLLEAAYADSWFANITADMFG